MEAVGRLAGGIATTLTMCDRHRTRRPAHGAENEFSGSALVAPHSIKDAAERRTGLTRQLLAFGRSELVEPQVLNLNQVLDGLNKMLRRLIGEDIELTMRPSTDPWPIEIDPRGSNRWSSTLAVNARDAMPDGGKLTIPNGQRRA